MHENNWEQPPIIQAGLLMNEPMEKAKEKLPARVYFKELIETIFRQPYPKGQFLVDARIARRHTAVEYLKELERIGSPGFDRRVEKSWGQDQSGICDTD
jgi:hypothetical protein